MSKRELIDCILEINRSAKPEFLATFPEEDLSAYLEHTVSLMCLDLAKDKPLNLVWIRLAVQITIYNVRSQVI